MLSVGTYSTLDADANSMPRTTHERPLEKQSPGGALTIRRSEACDVPLEEDLFDFLCALASWCLGGVDCHGHRDTGLRFKVAGDADGAGFLLRLGRGQ